MAPQPPPSPRAALISSLLPLVLFYVVDGWYGLRAAVVVAIAASLLEVGWSYRVQGRVPRMTLFTAGLVLVLGALSLGSDDERWVLYTPVLGDLAFATVLIGASLRGGSLLEAAIREQDPEADLHPLELRFLRGVTWRFAANLLAHASLTAWSIGQGKEMWLFVSGPVQYGMMLVQLGFEVGWGRLVVGPAVDKALAEPPPSA
jgi:intracellular septation protein A